MAASVTPTATMAINSALIPLMFDFDHAVGSERTPHLIDVKPSTPIFSWAAEAAAEVGSLAWADGLSLLVGVEGLAAVPRCVVWACGKCSSNFSVSGAA